MVFPLSVYRISVFSLKSYFVCDVSNGIGTTSALDLLYGECAMMQSLLSVILLFLDAGNYAKVMLKASA